VEEIIIDIDPEGNVRIEGKGIKGPDCLKLTAAIEEAIGTVTSRQKTAEFFQTPPIKRKVGA
jgi:hypothetical protein